MIWGNFVKCDLVTCSLGGDVGSCKELEMHNLVGLWENLVKHHLMGLAGRIRSAPDGIDPLLD